MYSAEAGTPIY